ncbi:phage tail sheath family protein [Paenibacillus sp. J2TS4]|uniref:phage tail sheath family protein n=1 Tax=Paenibacillus sp. J2TS4 TaxID=2807194 RepID=UPI001AFF37C5|nr:phage tail sheath family protein [Paenibacillus sp. J2TS4]GIP35505.1 hypothetical protein J2TS4_47150 [Paenibacillus sp. J2TS4]
MAGGTWTTQNKVRPGVYINFAGEAKPLGAMGDRGTVTMPLKLSWGKAKSVMTIHAGDNLKEALGYDLSAPQLRLVREALKRARTLLVYRVNAGVKATATLTSLNATAKHGGVRGNDIMITVQPNLDQDDHFDVRTLVAGEEVDLQTIGDLSELQANEWVEFEGEGVPEATAGFPLTGGEDGTATNEDYTDYLNAIEVHDFQTMALPSGEATLKSLYTSFIKRLRETEGRKVQAVLANYPEADYEGIISVKNGVILSDGTELDAVQATVWVAAATASAEVNESLTYQAYDDAVDVDVRYTNSEIEAALRGGEFVFVHNHGRAVIEQDINTFRSYAPNKGRLFSKNRAIRVLDGLANDFKRKFEMYYIGKVNNNADGRSLFRSECVNDMERYQNLNAIQNFNSQTDITVSEGDDLDSIFVETQVQPVDAIEKIYMKVKVK